VNLSSKIKSKLHQLHIAQEIKSFHLQYLFLEITKKCNLNCLHCGSDCSKDQQSPELTTESWFKIIDYVKQQFTENVAFVITGGEPLMHPDILSIGTHIRQNNMRWGMVTNGMLLNSNKLNELMQAGISSITVSLDGIKESHNWLRNSPGAFDRAIDAIRITANSTIPYKDVVSCVSPANLTHLDSIARLLIENGIKNWRLFRIFPSGRAQTNELLHLSYEQTQTLLTWITLNRNTYFKKGLKINLSCEGWVPFDLDRQLRDNPFFCRSGINTASILSDGTITGCSNNSKGFFVGNILTDNFAHVWRKKFDIFREKKWLQDTYCAKCGHYNLCKGGSIHLWEMGCSEPNFCYAIDLKKVKRSGNNP
jgi:radical SAM protein with 4Fe4S-binding SPASM domain